MATKKELREEYKALTGYAGSGMSKEELEKALDERKAREALAAEAAVLRRIEKEQAEALREKLQARRGTVAELAEKFGADYRDLPEDEADEMRMAAWAARWVVQAQAEYDADNARFQKRMAVNPADALTWSDSLFKTAAQNAVAQDVGRALESGVPMADMVAHCTQQALNGARNPSMSTSPTSNLVAQYTAAAWADAAQRFNRD